MLFWYETLPCAPRIVCREDTNFFLTINLCIPEAIGWYYAKHNIEGRGDLIPMFWVLDWYNALSITLRVEGLNPFFMFID